MFQCISDGDVWPTCSSEFMKLLEFVHVLTKKYCWVFCPLKTSDWWITHLWVNSISHNIVAQNSALILLWLLAHHFCFAGAFSQALNLTLSWEAEQLVSKLPLASAPPSSRSWHTALIWLPAHPPQGWGSGRAVPLVGLSHHPRHNHLGTLQMPPFHSFSPPTYCQIVENGKLSFSDSEKNPFFWYYWI